MLNDIQLLKEQLDEKIVQLGYRKLNSERFGYCLKGSDRDTLTLLRDYQKLLERVLLQNSPIRPTETVSITQPILNTTTGIYEYIAKTVVTTYMGNCVKKITTNTPSFDVDSNSIIFTTEEEYTQDLDCSNIQTDITCIDAIIEQIKSLV